MASVASTLLNTVVPPASAPLITNFVMTTAGVEYSHAFQPNCQRFEIKTRNKSNLQFSFTSGTTNTDFISLPGSACYSEDYLLVPSLTIYFQSNKNGDILEILEWS